MAETDTVEVILEDPRWAGLNLEMLAQTAIHAVQVRLGVDQPEISVLACDDARIAVLNAEFRDKPSATNVLSWPAQDLTPPDLPQPDPDGATELGDIAIAYDTCAREAEAQDKPIDHHLTHLLVHATLHLLGYDHQTDSDATLMEGLEVEILGNLGISNPYME